MAFVTLGSQRVASGIGGTRGAQSPAFAAGRPSRRAFVPSALFGSKKKTTSGTTTKRKTVVPEPAFNVPAGVLAIAGAAAYAGKVEAATLIGALGAFLALQTTRVRFKFDPDALEVVISGSDTETENAFVGGRNRWRYDTFVNWEMWWPGFPILVYFKETQTKPEGQIHFFPVLFNGKQLYDVMLERCGTTQTSGPKE